MSRGTTLVPTSRIQRIRSTAHGNDAQAASPLLCARQLNDVSVTGGRRRNVTKSDVSAHCLRRPSKSQTNGCMASQRGDRDDDCDDESSLGEGGLLPGCICVSETVRPDQHGGAGVGNMKHPVNRRGSAGAGDGAQLGWRMAKATAQDRAGQGRAGRSRAGFACRGGMVQ